MTLRFEADDFAAADCAAAMFQGFIAAADAAPPSAKARVPDAPRPHTTAQMTRQRRAAWCWAGLGASLRGGVRAVAELLQRQRSRGPGQHERDLAHAVLVVEVHAE